MKRLLGWVISITLVTVFCLIPVNTSARSQFFEITRYDPAYDYYPGKQWAILPDVEQAGWSKSGLADAEAFAKEGHTDALLVVHNGVIILAYGDYAKPLKLHSARKSLMSVMYGTLVDRNLVATGMTLEELGIDDISGLTPEEKKATVENLLTSKSGIYHPAAYETRGMREKRPSRGSHAPGDFWFYNNWDFNALLSIFNMRSDLDFFEAFQKELAEPLEMQEFRLSDTRYYREGGKSVHPAYLFKMSALDLARVGLLYLREGAWRGSQLISRNWVQLSTGAVHKWKKGKTSVGYGYMWWVTKDGYYAAGRGGQRLKVIPDQELVIVHLVNTRNGKRVKSSRISRLFRKIIKARKSS